MRYQMPQKLLLLPVFLLLTVSFTVLLCYNDALYAGDTTKTNKSENNQISHKQAPGIMVEFLPLTYNQFTAIRDNNEQFALIDLIYISRTSDLKTRLFVKAGSLTTSRFLNSIDIYKGSLYQRDYTVSPPVGNYSKTSFTPSDLDIIFNYLEDHEGYFFDGSEYEDLDLPVKSYGATICRDNYVFSLAIVEPGSMRAAWGIHKCVEEVYPDHPLHGLFELLEENFIDEF